MTFKMHASKENARKALEVFKDLPLEDRSTGLKDDFEMNAKAAFIQGFLEAAIKKLPTEKSFERTDLRTK